MDGRPAAAGPSQEATVSESKQQSAVPGPPTAPTAQESTPTPKEPVAPQADAEGVELTDDQLGQVSGGAGMGDVAMGAARNLR